MLPFVMKCVDCRSNQISLKPTTNNATMEVYYDKSCKHKSETDIYLYVLETPLFHDQYTWHSPIVLV